MEKKIKILALFGKSGAGKDTIQKWLAGSPYNTHNMHSIVSYTTRPPRENEIDGIDYHFISLEEFEKKDGGCDFLEISQFNTWYYGTSIDSLNKNKINVGIFNIQGINNLLSDDRIEVLPVFIYCQDIIRLSRSLNRESNPNCHEICRRFLADEKDFGSIPFEYITFDNSHPYDGFYGILNIPEVKDFIKDVNN